MNSNFQSELLALLLFSTLQRDVMAQSQTVFNRFDDFGNDSVQTFITVQAGFYTGVSLRLRGHGEANAVTVYVRDLLANGSLAPALLATGSVPASAISTAASAWYFFQFNVPVMVLAGEDYGLVLNQFGSSAAGFVDYGSSTGNPYANGRMTYESSSGQPLTPISPDLDLAFQNTVVAPEPGTVSLISVGGAALAWSRRSKRTAR